jgi:hypothetical protein
MARSEVEQLCAEVLQLSGRAPVSRNLKYLRERVAQLRATPAYSVGEWRYQLVLKMARDKSVSPNAVVRRALDEYAVKNGYGADVERCGRGEGKA